MSRRRAFVALLVGLAYLALTVLFTYPAALHLGTHHIGEAGGDAKIYLWNYWWVRRALFELGTSPFATEAIFHPVGIGLAFHTLASSHGLLFSASSALAGEVAGANLVVLWTFLGSALATYALARSAGAGRMAAFLGGMIFAFCPARLARLSGHYDLLGTEWIPLYALFLTRLGSEKRFASRFAILAGATAALCGYTALSYLVFLGLFTALYLAFHGARIRELAPRIGASWALACLLLAPLLHQAYRDRTSWTYLPYPGADRYVADLWSLFSRSTAVDENLTETTVFAGYLVVGLGLAGVALVKRIEGISFWLLSAGAFFLLSLGPSLRVAGIDTGIPLPFALLAKLPLLDELRAPSRFSIPTMLSLAMVFALVWTHLVRGLRFQKLAAAAAGAILVVEYLAVPVPLFAASSHQVYQRIARDPDPVTVVEVPGIEQAAAETMYHQRVHGKPIFVGTAARVPREKSEYYPGLPLVRPLIDLRKGRIALERELVEREKRSAPAAARFLGLGYFVIDRAYEKRGVVSFLEQVLPVTRWYEDGALVVLKTRREELPRDPFVIAPGPPESRQHFESGWSRAEAEGASRFRWALGERSTILFRRPAPSIGSITLALAPLEGLELSVEARVDGRLLGTRRLKPGWQDVVLELPVAPREEAAFAIERLTLQWSASRRASETDPRRLAARIREARFP